MVSKHSILLSLIWIVLITVPISAEPSSVKIRVRLDFLSWNVTGDRPGQAQRAIYSADGRKVYEEAIEGRGNWRPSFLPSGVYLAQIDAGKHRQKAKLVILK